MDKEIKLKMNCRESKARERCTEDTRCKGKTRGRGNEVRRTDEK